MKYNPESANANLIPDKTWCEAEIIKAEEATSKAGNEMIVADFLIYDPAGIQPTIRHYFVSNMPGMFKKLCTAIDLPFDSGDIPASSLEGKTVKVLIKVHADKTGQFPDKNVLAAFSKEFPADAPNHNGTVRQGLPDLPHDDDCPF